jgi:arylsulfatase
MPSASDGLDARGQFPKMVDLAPAWSEALSRRFLSVFTERQAIDRGKHSMFIRTLGILLAGLGPLHAFAAETEGARPNFIFYISDDISFADYGCYGHPTIKTPAMDLMAEQGRLFTRAYLTTSSCSPTRCSIITGRYPHNTGASELHRPLPDSQVIFPQLLHDAGYYTVLSGKHHMGRAVDRGFDLVERGKGPGGQETWVGLIKDRPKDRPFFFWLASNDAHHDFKINGDAPEYDPADVVVPPYLPDTPKVRQEFADYYHEVSRADFYLGQLCKELVREGIAANTYVIFCSDNGRPMPRAKSWLVEEGIRTPLVVWKGDTLEPGATDALVSVIDISATVLDLAGVAKPEAIQGVSFATVIEDPTKTTRDVVFAEHNWHVHQAHERMVRHGDYLYIKNNWPELWTSAMESGPWFDCGRELQRVIEAGEATRLQASIFEIPRPSEQLYHLPSDPLTLDNIADSNDNRVVLDTMRGLLATWTEQTGDSVPTDPTPNRSARLGSREANPEFRYREQPGDATDAAQINHPGPVRVSKDN